MIRSRRPNHGTSAVPRWGATDRVRLLPHRLWLGTRPAADAAAAQSRPGHRELLARLVGCFMVAALLGAPLAATWAVTQTSVRELVGITPTTFSFSTAGRSEFRLGIAGTIYLPIHRGPLGVVATVEGPGVPDASTADLAAYASPQMLKLYTGLFHDPGPAVNRYVDRLTTELRHQLLLAELLLAGVGGIALFLVSLLLARTRPAVPPHRLPRVAAAMALGMVATSLVAGAATTHQPGTARTAGPYALPVLDGTPVAGATTDSPVLRLLLGDAVPKAQKLVRRQDDAMRQYLDDASAGLRDQKTAMAGPGPNEVAVLMQSDMHCNSTMIRLQAQVADQLRARFGETVPALMAVTGDLTTNGTAAEGSCIEAEAAIAAGAPVGAIGGNHESKVSVSQMKSAGMTVLDGSVSDLADVRVLGGSDPERSELFGSTRPRGAQTETSQGQDLYDTAAKDRPDLVLVHEGYAAREFIGTTDMTSFLDGRGSATKPWEDAVRDLPAAAVFYGHWHRSIEPRVVWNADGTWTLVMELDTSGGAIDTPTIGHFSTPWSRPQQDASFPVVFLDADTRLVTGYQLYQFKTDATVQVLPRVDIGSPPAAGALATSRTAGRQHLATIHVRPEPPHARTVRPSR